MVIFIVFCRRYVWYNVFFSHVIIGIDRVISCPAGTYLELRSRDVPAPDNKSLGYCCRNYLPTVINTLVRTVCITEKYILSIGLQRPGCDILYIVVRSVSKHQNPQKLWQISEILLRYFNLLSYYFFLVILSKVHSFFFKNDVENGPLVVTLFNRHIWAVRLTTHLKNIFD